MRLPDGWIDTTGRFPAPQWQVIYDLSQQLNDAADREMTIALLDEWSERLRAALGDRYEIIDTQHFVLVSGVDSKQGDVLGRSMERARDRILERLTDVALDREYPRHLAVVFAERRMFLQYVSAFYPDGGEYGTPGGLYVPDGLGHFLIAPESIESQEAAITHELTHVLLGHLDLPAWLNEGVARAMELAVGLRRPELYDRETVEEHLDFWTDERLERFWAGETFHDLEGQKLSYSLAEFLVKSLPGDEQQILEFIRTADFADSGFAAARETLGVDLNDVAAPLTGFANETEDDGVE